MNQLATSITEFRTHTESIVNHVDTEADTTVHLVLPFLKVLGYDTRDPREVRLEYDADISGKGEKVDIAIIKDNVPILLIECKSVKTKLSQKEISQLYRYFVSTDVRFGVLTNGLQYCFYSDLDKPNRMDKNPFMEINIDKDTPERIGESLQKFTKSEFNEEAAIDFAEKFKYRDAIKQLLTKQLEKPSHGFVSFILGEVYEGTKTKKVRDSFVNIVHDAFREFLDDHSIGPDPKEWISLSEFNYDDYKQKNGKSPPLVRLWDGKDRKPKYWKDLLKITVELLYADRALTVNQLPYSSSPRRYIVHTEPIHPNGRAFDGRYSLPNAQIYVETNRSTEGILDWCRELLVDFGKNPETDMLLKIQ